MNNEIEIWKDVENFEGKYQISNLARVKSLSRKVWGGRKFCIKKEKILKSHPDTKGYLRVQLYNNGKPLLCAIHRLVAKAFISNPFNLPQINHKNTNILDNSIDNLEWTNNSGNVKHGYLMGLNKPRRGENSPVSKLNWMIVNEIRNLYKLKNHTMMDLSEMYNVSDQCICDVINFKTWKIYEKSID